MPRTATARSVTSGSSGPVISTRSPRSSPTVNLRPRRLKVPRKPSSSTCRRQFSFVRSAGSSFGPPVARREVFCGPSNGLHQQFRVIGDDPVNAHPRCAKHFATVVDGPGNHGFSRSMELVNQPPREQSVVRNDVLDRKPAPAAKLPPGLRQRAQNQRWVEGIQAEHNAGQKRRDEIAFRMCVVYLAHHALLDPADLDLDIEEGGAAVPLKYAAQAWRNLFRWAGGGTNLFQAGPADDQPVKLGIVADDALEVAGGAHIEFKSIGALGQRQVEGADGIFLSVLAGAAV